MIEVLGNRGEFADVPGIDPLQHAGISRIRLPYLYGRVGNIQAMSMLMPMFFRVLVFIAMLFMVWVAVIPIMLLLVLVVMARGWGIIGGGFRGKPVVGLLRLKRSVF